MTQQITGTVENGDRAVADFPFYRGTVGVRVRTGSEIAEVAYRSEVGIGGLPSRGRRAIESADRAATTLVRLPVRGRLDGEEVEILTLEVSQTDRKMMLATVRLVPPAEVASVLVTR